MGRANALLRVPRPLASSFYLRRTPAPPLRHHISHATSRIVNPLPQLEVTGELTFFVIKLLVRRISLLLGLHGAVAHVLYAQGAGNHQGLVKRAALAGFKQHAAHPRVQWQAAELLAQGGDLMGIVHRTQLIEQLVAVGNGAACGGF